MEKARAGAGKVTEWDYDTSQTYMKMTNRQRRADNYRTSRRNSRRRRDSQEVTDPARIC